jgi:hypothetical protein
VETKKRPTKNLQPLGRRSRKESSANERPNRGAWQSPRDHGPVNVLPEHDGPAAAGDKCRDSRHWRDSLSAENETDERNQEHSPTSAADRRDDPRRKPGSGYEQDFEHTPARTL